MASLNELRKDTITPAVTRGSSGLNVFSTLDPADYSGQLGDTLYGNKTSLDIQRANAQSNWESAGNFLARGVGKALLSVPETAGYILDIPGWVGANKDYDNVLSTWAREGKEFLDEELPEYSRDTIGHDSFNPASFGWWMRNGDSVIESLGYFVPGMALGKGVTAALKLGKEASVAANIARGMNRFSKLSTTAERIAEAGGTLTAAIASNHAEGMQIAAQTYKDVYTSVVNNVGDAKAKELASEAAGKVVRGNLVMAVPEFFEMRLMFKNFDSLRRGANFSKNWIGRNAPELLKQAGLEGGEEWYQGFIERESKRTANIEAGVIEDDKSNVYSRIIDYITSDEGMTEGFLGAIGGLGFGAIGGAMNMNKSARDRKRGIDIISQNQSALKKIMQSQGQLIDMMGKEVDKNNPTAVENAIKGIFLNRAWLAAEAGTFSQLEEYVESMQNASQEEIEKNGWDRKTIAERVPQFKKLLSQVEDVYNKVNSLGGSMSNEFVGKMANHLLKQMAAQEGLAQVENDLQLAYADLLKTIPNKSTDFLSLHPLLLERVILEQFAKAYKDEKWRKDNNLNYSPDVEKTLIDRLLSLEVDLDEKSKGVDTGKVLDNEVANTTISKIITEKVRNLILYEQEKSDYNFYSNPRNREEWELKNEQTSTETQEVAEEKPVDKKETKKEVPTETVDSIIKQREQEIEDIETLIEAQQVKFENTPGADIDAHNKKITELRDKIAKVRKNAEDRISKLKKVEDDGDLKGNKTSIKNKNQEETQEFLNLAELAKEDILNVFDSFERKEDVGESKHKGNAVTIKIKNSVIDEIVIWKSSKDIGFNLKSGKSSVQITDEKKLLQLIAEKLTEDKRKAERKPKPVITNEPVTSITVTPEILQTLEEGSVLQVETANDSIITLIKTKEGFKLERVLYQNGISVPEVPSNPEIKLDKYLIAASSISQKDYDILIATLNAGAIAEQFVGKITKIKNGKVEKTQDAEGNVVEDETPDGKEEDRGEDVILSGDFGSEWLAHTKTTIKEVQPIESKVTTNSSNPQYNQGVATTSLTVDYNSQIVWNDESKGRNPENNYDLEYLYSGEANNDTTLQLEVDTTYGGDNVFPYTEVPVILVSKTRKETSDSPVAGRLGHLPTLVFKKSINEYDIARTTSSSTAYVYWSLEDLLKEKSSISKLPDSDINKMTLLEEVNKAIDVRRGQIKSYLDMRKALLGRDGDFTLEERKNATPVKVINHGQTSGIVQSKKEFEPAANVFEGNNAFGFGQYTLAISHTPTVLGWGGLTEDGLPVNKISSLGVSAAISGDIGSVYLVSQVDAKGGYIPLKLVKATLTDLSEDNQNKVVDKIISLIQEYRDTATLSPKEATAKAKDIEAQIAQLYMITRSGSERGHGNIVLDSRLYYDAKNPKKGANGSYFAIRTTDGGNIIEHRFYYRSKYKDGYANIKADRQGNAQFTYQKFVNGSLKDTRYNVGKKTVAGALKMIPFNVSTNLVNTKDYVPLVKFDDELTDYNTFAMKYLLKSNNRYIKKSDGTNFQINGKSMMFGNPNFRISLVARDSHKAAPQVSTDKKADIEKLVLGKFAIETKKVVSSKGPSNGRTIVRSTKRKVSSDGEVLIITPHNTFEDTGETLATRAIDISFVEFKEHYYPLMAEEQIELFEAALGENVTSIQLKEIRIGLKDSHLKGQINIDVLVVDDLGVHENGAVLNRKLTDAELAALEGKKETTKETLITESTVTDDVNPMSEGLTQSELTSIDRYLSQENLGNEEVLFKGIIDKSQYLKEQYVAFKNKQEYNKALRGLLTRLKRTSDLSLKNISQRIVADPKIQKEIDYEIFRGEDLLDNTIIIDRLLEFDYVPTELIPLIKLLRNKVGQTRKMERFDEDYIYQFYDVATNTIFVSYENFDDRESFARSYVHELLHHYTFMSLHAPETEQEIEFSNNIRQLYIESVNKTKFISEHYGFSNIYEFVSEARTNKAFQKELNKKGLWESVIDFIVELLTGEKRESKRFRETKKLVDNFVKYVNDNNINRIYTGNETLNSIKRPLNPSFTVTQEADIINSLTGMLMNISVDNPDVPIYDYQDIDENSLETLLRQEIEQRISLLERYKELDNIKIFGDGMSSYRDNWKKVLDTFEPEGDNYDDYPGLFRKVIANLASNYGYKIKKGKVTYSDAQDITKEWDASFLKYNPKDKVDTLIKAEFLTMLDNEQNELLGIPLYINFNKIFPAVLRRLNNKPTIAEKIHELRRMAILYENELNVGQAFSKIIAKLENTSDVQLRSKFYQSFNSYSHNQMRTVVERTEDGFITRNIVVTSKDFRKELVDMWKTNYHTKLEQILLSTNNSIESVSNYNKSKRAEYTRKVNTTFAAIERATTEQEISNALNPLLEVFQDMGITLNRPELVRSAIMHYITDPENLQLAMEIANTESKVVAMKTIMTSSKFGLTENTFTSKKGIFAIMEKGQSPFAGDTAGWFNNIADIISPFFLEEYDNITLTIDNEKQWVINTPNQLAILMSKLNSKTEASEILSNFGYLGNSNWISLMMKNGEPNFAEIVKFDYAMHQGVMLGDEGVAYERLNDIHRTLSSISLFLDSYQRGIKDHSRFWVNMPYEADKTRHYIMNVPKFASSVNELGKYEFVSGNPSFDALLKTVKQERDNILNLRAKLQEVIDLPRNANGTLNFSKEIDVSGLTPEQRTTYLVEPLLVNRKGDKYTLGNGLKFNFIKSLNEFAENELFNDSILKQHLTDYIKQSYTEFRDKLIEEGLIYIEEGIVKSDYISEQVLIDGYDRSLNHMLIDYFVNYTIAQREIKGLLTGFDGEYKNIFDEGKRMAQYGAPYQSLYTEYINKQYANLVIRDVTLSIPDEDWNALAERTGLTLAQTKKQFSFLDSIDTNDAQGFCTVKRYREILMGAGRYPWSKEKLDILDRIENGVATQLDFKSIMTQPLKGFYYKRIFDEKLNTHRSIQVKYALFPLTKQFTEGLQLDALREKAEQLEQDSKLSLEIIPESAFKVGRVNVNKLHDDQGNILDDLSSITKDSLVLLDNDGWGIQQDVPAHELDHDQKLGVQIAKLALSNINMSNIYMFNGKEITGRELVDIFSEATVKNLNEDLTKVINSIINDEDIRRRLEEEIDESGKPYNLKGLLETQNGKFILPLAFNISSKEFQPLLKSIFNKVRDLTMPGGPMIQVSDVFMRPKMKAQSTTEGIQWIDGHDKKLKMHIENNTIYAECVIPPGTEKFFINGVLDINKIQKECPEALEMIGYRIPTSSKSYSMVLKVVGFSNKTVAGESIIVPYQLMKHMGFDFDVDKMFTIHRRIGISDGTNISKGNIVPKGNFFIFDSPDPKTGNERYMRDNQIFDVLKTIIQSPHHFNEVVASGEFKRLEDAAEEYALSKVVPDGNTITGQRIMNERNMMAVVMKGVFANNNGFIPIAQIINLKSLQSLNVKIDGKSYNLDQFGKIGDSFKNLDGEDITALCGEFVNAIMDAAKTPTTALININMYTANVAFTMIAMGLNFKQVAAFMQQPIIRKATQLDTNADGYFVRRPSGFSPNLEARKLLFEFFELDSYGIDKFNKYLHDAAIVKGKKQNKYIEPFKYDEKQVYEIDINELNEYYRNEFLPKDITSKKDKLEWLVDNYDYVVAQLKVSNVYGAMNRVATAYGQANSALSSDRNNDSNLNTIHRMDETREKLSNPLTAILSSQDLDGVYHEGIEAIFQSNTPYPIAKAYWDIDDAAIKYLTTSSRFFLHSPKYRNAFNRLLKSIGITNLDKEGEEQMFFKFSNAVMAYINSQNGMLSGVNVNYYLSPEYINKFIKQRKIAIKNGFTVFEKFVINQEPIDRARSGGISMITFDTERMTDFLKDEYSAQLSDFFFNKYPEDISDEEYDMLSEFAFDLLYYQFATTGFIPTKSSINSIIPYEMWLSPSFGIAENIQSHTLMDATHVVNNEFIKMFVQHNASNKRIAFDASYFFNEKSSRKRMSTSLVNNKNLPENHVIMSSNKQLIKFNKKTKIPKIKEYISRRITTEVNGQKITNVHLFEFVGLVGNSGIWVRIPTRGIPNKAFEYSNKETSFPDNMTEKSVDDLLVGIKKTFDNFALYNGVNFTNSIEEETEYEDVSEENEVSLEMENQNIYSQLGQKTKSKNIVFEDWSKLKNYKNPISPISIVSTRIVGTDKHFGNPFSSDESVLAKNPTLIKTNSTKESVEKYIDWVINSKEPRAEWIRKELKSGEHKNKAILYYKELNEPSHATALDYLINNYNWNESKRVSWNSVKERLQSSPLHKDITEENEVSLEMEIDTSKKINIYAGTNENAELSNFAVRPFSYKGITYKTVEGAFQAAKLDYAEKSQSYNDEGITTEEYKQNFSDLSGNLAKQQGRTIKGLNTKTWDANSSRIMKDLLLESFKQNPQALQKLLATGNAELTHTQDKGKWGKEFPKLLMEVRAELGGSKKVSLDMKMNKYNPIPLQDNFTRESVKKDSNYIYLFTDNAGRTSGSNKIKPNWYTDKYGIEGNYPTMTQAVIRGLENAFPITTMVDDKRTQWTDDRFEEYKKIIDSEIEEIKTSILDGDFKGVKFSANNPFGEGNISKMKSSAPKIWNYMNEKLKEIGIDNTGIKPIIISNNINLSWNSVKERLQSSPLHKDITEEVWNTLPENEKQKILDCL